MRDTETDNLTLACVSFSHAHVWHTLYACHVASVCLAYGYKGYETLVSCHF